MVIVMRYSDYKIHDWLVVAGAFERLIRIHNPNFFKKDPDLNYLKEIINPFFLHVSNNNKCRFL